MGDEPILPIIQPITIDTMLNWITDRYFKVKNRVEFHYVWTVLKAIQSMVNHQLYQVSKFKSV